MPWSRSPFPPLDIKLFRHFGYQLQFSQRAYEFGVRLLSGWGYGVDRGMVAVFGLRDGLGDVRIPITLGPAVVDVQFHLSHPLP